MARVITRKGASRLPAMRNFGFIAGDNMKLNLGAGEQQLEGYTNLDRKTGQEVYPLSGFLTDHRELDECDRNITEIRASHVLEPVAASLPWKAE